MKSVEVTKVTNGTYYNLWEGDRIIESNSFSGGIMPDTPPFEGKPGKTAWDYALDFPMLWTKLLPIAITYGIAYGTLPSNAKKPTEVTASFTPEPLIKGMSPSSTGVTNPSPTAAQIQYNPQTKTVSATTAQKRIPSITKTLIIAAVVAVIGLIAAAVYFVFGRKK